MPKLKTHRGAAKRFKKTKNGGIKHRCANRNHILTKRNRKAKRHLKAMPILSRGDAQAVERMLVD